MDRNKIRLKYTQEGMCVIQRGHNVYAKKRESSNQEQVSYDATDGKWILHPSVRLPAHPTVTR